MESKKLIPKAQFGTGIVRRGLRWLSNHAVPTREQILFEVQNQQRIAKQKPRELRDLQQDLKNLGYYNKSVDGQMGPGTRNAIQQAQADGYKVDMNNFMVNGKKRLQKREGTTNTIKTLQQELTNKGFYKGDIDGQMGPKTKSAITMAAINGYIVENNALKVKEIKKENLRHFQNQKGTFSINNPILRTVQDFFQAKRNKQYNDVDMDPVTGMPLFSKPKSQTIKRLPLSQLLTLQELIKFKGTPKKGGFTSNDWRSLQGTYTGGKRSWIDRSFGPLQSIEHCLGQFSWHTNDKGEIVVTDTFDWNEGDTSSNQGWYTKARDFMGKNGTLSTAPDNEKTKYEINLGKPENW